MTTPVRPRQRPGDLLDAEMEDLSGGNVVRVQPIGPIFDRPCADRPTSRSTFVRTLGRRDRLVVAALTAGWLVSFLAFWAWWFRPEHRVGWVGLSLNSLLLLYVTLTPGYYLLAAARLRHVNPQLEVPQLRVAFVVTRAPSEAWSVARTTLEAMLAQRYPYPYHVWLCDEEPSEEILKWCGAHGVGVSCRHGIADYHRATWPRRTRCKEGNLAYFYDHWGYQDYDVVAQLDCDHVPHRTYLAMMVRPFADPAIGYVSAPSVCDANAAASWSARGRLYREAASHGPLQLGHNDGLAPMSVGSHYAVRTRALRDIGGLGPELAEDFSTTFLLCSAGWRGAFAIRAKAHGDGPFTVADMLVQEFQWSRSLTTMLYDLAPHHLGRLSGVLRLRFGYTLAYYPLVALMTATGVALPPVAAVTGLPWVNVNYVEFLEHSAALSVWPLLLTVLLRRRGLQRPHHAPIASWESALYALTRWPYIVWGVVAGTLQNGSRAVTFKVTPKSHSGQTPLRARLMLPYLAITLVLSAAAMIGERVGSAAGYVFLCLLGAFCYAIVSLAVPALHILESARAAGRRRSAAVATAGVPLFLGAASFVPLGLAMASFPGVAIQAFGW